MTQQVTFALLVNCLMKLYFDVIDKANNEGLTQHEHPSTFIDMEQG